MPSQNSLDFLIVHIVNLDLRICHDLLIIGLMSFDMLMIILIIGTYTERIL